MTSDICAFELARLGVSFCPTRRFLLRLRVRNAWLLNQLSKD